MGLPNFINFEPFNVLRQRMRTQRLGRFGPPDWVAPVEPSELPPVPAGAPGVEPGAARGRRRNRPAAAP